MLIEMYYSGKTWGNKCVEGSHFISMFWMQYVTLWLNLYNQSSVTIASGPGGWNLWRQTFLNIVLTRFSFYLQILHEILCCFEYYQNWLLKLSCGIAIRMGGDAASSFSKPETLQCCTRYAFHLTLALSGLLPKLFGRGTTGVYLKA